MEWSDNSWNCQSGRLIGTGEDRIADIWELDEWVPQPAVREAEKGSTREENM